MSENNIVNPEINLLPGTIVVDLKVENLPSETVPPVNAKDYLTGEDIYNIYFKSHGLTGHWASCNELVKFGYNKMAELIHKELDSLGYKLVKVADPVPANITKT